jgi:hypothetical protein
MKHNSMKVELGTGILQGTLAIMTIMFGARARP